MHGVRSTAWFAAGEVRATAGKDPSGPGGGSQDFLKTRQIFASREPGVSGQRAVFRRTPPRLEEKTRCQFPAARVRQTAGSRQRAALAAVGLPGGPSPYALPADSLAVHTARYFSEAGFGCCPLSGALRRTRARVLQRSRGLHPAGAAAVRRGAGHPRRHRAQSPGLPRAGRGGHREAALPSDLLAGREQCR